MYAVRKRRNKIIVQHLHWLTCGDTENGLLPLWLLNFTFQDIFPAPWLLISTVRRMTWQKGADWGDLIKMLETWRQVSVRVSDHKQTRTAKCREMSGKIRVVYLLRFVTCVGLFWLLRLLVITPFDYTACCFSFNYRKNHSEMFWVYVLTRHASAVSSR